MGHSDEELLRRVAEGDTAAFDVLFERYGDFVHDLAFRRAASWSVAEDVTAIVFLELWRQRRRLVTRDGSLRPWLVAVAINQVKRGWTGQARQRSLADRWPRPVPGGDHADDVAARLDDEARMRHLNAALDALPAPFRDVLTLWAYSYWAPDPAMDPTPRWYHWTDDFAPGGTADEIAANFDALFGTGSGLDPATLFDELEGAGPFDEVGDETVDGVATRRLRATHPETILGLCGGNAGFEPGGVTTLDIWIEDSGFVRRVDGTWRGSGAGANGDADADVTGSFSITFSGYGEPITIEVPPDAVDASLHVVLAGR